MSTHEIDAPPTHAERRQRDLAESVMKLRTDISRVRRDRGDHSDRMVMGVRVADVERVLDGLLLAQETVALHERSAALHLDEETRR